MEPITCRSGAWTFDVDPTTGFVRRVRYGTEMIALSIYCAVRDPNWGTYNPVVSDMRATPDGCRWKTTVEGAPFQWTTEAKVGKDGFSLVVEGKATEAFRTCRTGLCFLHPMALAGTSATVHHADGTEGSASFPLHVSPFEPFQDFQELHYNARYGPKVEIQFKGEVFSTEDQRNWSDASYKTYCKPPGSGRPYELGPDQPLRHEVQIRCTGEPSIEAMPNRLAGQFPTWALWLDGPPDQQIPGLAAAGVLRAATIDPRAIEPALKRGIALDLRLAAAHWAETQPMPAPGHGSVLWIVADAWGRDLELAVQNASKTWGQQGWAVGWSTSGNFTEVNRSRPPEKGPSHLGFCASPQIHTFDPQSILENALTYSSIGSTMRTFPGEAKLCAGPIRFDSPYKPSDPRGRGPLGAAFNALAMAALSAGRFDQAILGTATHFLDAGSEAGEVLRAWVRVQPKRTSLGLTGDTIDTVFESDRGRVAWKVNPLAKAQGGLPPFTASLVRGG